MTGDVKHVSLSDANLREIAEAVSSDRVPRVLEHEGRPIAALVSMEDLNRLLLAVPSREGTESFLKVAGAWRDMDTDALIERIYRERHEVPQPPVDL